MTMLLMESKRQPLISGHFLDGKIPVLMSFSRLSAAMRTNGAGFLESVGTNVPRFDWREDQRGLSGLLVEPQRTNAHPRSWRISAWGNNNAVSVTNDVYVSPDGTQNASQIVTAATYGGRYISVTGLSPSTDYAVSGYLKVFSGVTTIRIGTAQAEGTTAAHIQVDAAAGTIMSCGAAAYDRYAVLLPNGWTYFRYRIRSGAAQTSTAFVAYSMEGGATFSVWGVQVEAGTRASGLIPTDGSAVTRAADELSFSILNGVSALRFVFDDDSTQDVAVSVGAYTVPTNLNRARIQQLYSL